MKCKQIKDGYIVAIGDNIGGVEITDEEYNSIKAVIDAKPARTDTTDYRLKDDLTWEVYAIEPAEEEDEEVTAEEIAAAIEEALA